MRTLIYIALYDPPRKQEICHFPNCRY